MSTYTQLSQKQRYQIYDLKKAGHNQSEIADLMGIHKPTISRELRRNRGLRGYRPKQAHQLATDRYQSKSSCCISPEDWRLTDQLLRKD